MDALMETQQENYTIALLALHWDCFLMPKPNFSFIVLLGIMDT